MKVVLGVDGSPASMKAVECVADFADAIASVLVIAAVHTGLAMPDSELVRIERETAEGHVRDATAKLAALGTRVTFRVIDGDPRQVLVDTARTENADLLVVGSRGRTGIARLLLGSVASHVAGHAPCSVFIARGRESQGA